MARRKSYFRKSVRKSAASRRYYARRRSVYNARVRTARKRRFARIYRNPLAKDRQLACLHYNVTRTLNPTAEGLTGGTNVWQFSANSLYDPDTTGIGHQPMYFDNYSSVYWRYRVNYAKVTVTVLNHSVNTATSGTVADTLYPNYSYKLFILRDSTASTSEFPSNMNDIIEEAGSQVRWRFVGPSLTGKLPKLSHVVSPHQIANRSFKDDSLAGTYLASPEQPVYFYVGITSADGVTDPPIVYVNVHITYWCEFFDRKAIQGQN